MRWPTSKDADPMVKWVVGTMADVVKEAISKIRKHTQEAREMAKWYEKSPDTIYLTKHTEHLRKKELLNREEISQILGLSGRDSVHAWAKPKGGIKKIIGNEILYYFRYIKKEVIKMLPKNFPMLDRETGLKYNDALFISPLNRFHQTRATYTCMFEAITTFTVNTGLGGGLTHGRTSVFSRIGFTEPDGSHIKITTHQFRHWLNTLAQKGGLSQLDIAKWSGRKDIRQNQDYDHVTADEMLEKIRNIDDGSMFGPLAEFINKTPISREEFLELEFPTVHTTELGFCIHDWTMIPCQKHRDCINCTEHICIKGDVRKTERIRQCLRDAEEQLSRAEESMENEYAGADRWVEHHRMTIERLRNLVELFDDPSIPVGSVIRLSNKKEFSQIGVAVDDRRKLGDSDGKMLNRLRSLISKNP